MKKACAFENFQLKIKDYAFPKKDFEVIKGFYESPKRFLYMWGGTGTGKTHLARAIGKQAGKFENSWHEKEWNIKFVTHNEFYFMMQDWVFEWQKIRKELTGHWKFDRLMMSRGIIIDDLGSEMDRNQEATEYGLIELIENSNTKLIITSNRNEKSFRDKYGDKIGSRLFDKSLCIKIGFSGYDYRELGENERKRI